MTDFKKLQKRIGQSAEANGWHNRWKQLRDANDIEGQREHVISKVALITSELSEAVEELRDGRGFTETYASEGGKPEGFPVELADAVIRALDLAEMLGIELKDVIQNKLDFNALRGEMHGGRTI